MKPILMNTEMVRAILDGRKTVTRRNPFHFEMLGNRNPKWSGYSLGEYFTGKIESGACLYSRGGYGGWEVVSNVVKPKYLPGDILYVRETWAKYDRLYYRATDWDAAEPIDPGDVRWFKWKPSIHMQKEAARIFLRVTCVRIERLRDISKDQAIKEGIYIGAVDMKNYANNKAYAMLANNLPKAQFADMWNATIKKLDINRYGWDANPWVLVIEFEQITKEEAHESSTEERK